MKIVRQVNDAIALVITNFIGSMWCAYLFAAYSIWQAPATIRTLGFGNWFTEEFLQLVLLSVIMVGQNVVSRKHDELLTSHQDLHAKVDALSNSPELPLAARPGGAICPFNLSHRTCIRSGWHSKARGALGMGKAHDAAPDFALILPRRVLVLDPEFHHDLEVALSLVGQECLADLGQAEPGFFGEMVEPRLQLVREADVQRGAHQNISAVPAIRSS